MAKKGKKIAAALAAVGLYLEQEEAAAIGQKGALPGAGICVSSQWNQTGRQEMMTMRRLIQLRTFTRF
ncbi:MAG: hypothetical protein JRJ68_02115 [Deltaproteobacteria bacterium]|nr:hypothetical protein [Deltaproteobacteria bacterium]